MNNKKKIILSVLVVLLLLAIGVTYAFFTYESGTKSDVVTGQIYMNYEETSTISLTGVFPETKEQALARQDENGVFEFTITGRNTSKYPVYYEIDLLEGGVMTGKTETSTKILPEHVMIYLEKDGVPVIEGKTYADWNNKPIYVETVPAGTTTNIEHKYTLRMWIDENVTISDTDPNADYTTSEWNDAYTSLKVRVVGDFEYKDMSTDASCFAYNVIAPDGYIAYDFPNITLDTSDEKVEACKTNMMNNWGEDLSTAQDNYQSFCEGTGTIDIETQGYSVMTLKEYVNYTMLNAPGFIIEQTIQSLSVVSDINYESRVYELNTSEESVNSCKEVMMNYVSSDESDAGDGYQSFCEGTGTLSGYDSSNGTIYTWANYAGDLAFALIERNVFTQVEELPKGGAIEITNYDESCGTDVVIPSVIDGLPVTKITGDHGSAGSGVVYIGAFASKLITSVKLPDTLEYIGDSAFLLNVLTRIVIPDNVTEIEEGAFSHNKITDVEIGTGIMSIGEEAFAYNPLVTVNIKSNPSLGDFSFSTTSSYYLDRVFNFQTFQYGGTCEELNQNSSIFSSHPQTIITTDNNACEFTNEK